jgi:hypothetical protein
VHKNHLQYQTATRHEVAAYLTRCTASGNRIIVDVALKVQLKKQLFIKKHIIGMDGQHA